MKYPKIQTYWKRDDNGVIVRDFDNLANPAFGLVNKWVITEKIDGTNTRIMKRDDKIIFGGRNHDETSKKFGQPPKLMKYLRETFTIELLTEVFGDANVTLFGEGYGAGIQKGGGAYRADASFILFDVIIHDITKDWWMEREKVNEMAKSLGIVSVPIGDRAYTFEEIEKMVMQHPMSEITIEKKISEGYVCRTEPLLFDRRGHLLMFKLKVRDYIAYAKKIKEEDK